MTLLGNILWELIAMEAERSYFIDNAENPAITINTSYLTAPDAKKNEHYTLYFGSGIAHYNFTSMKKAEGKALEILRTAKKTIRVTVKYRHKKLVKYHRFPPPNKREETSQTEEKK